MSTENNETKAQIIFVEDLNLNNRVKNVLRFYNIKSVEDLIDLDYERLILMHGMGEKGVSEILEVIHEQGYTLTYEGPKVEKEALKDKGTLILEDYGFPANLYEILYRNGIYTIEQLKEKKDTLKEIKGFGPVRQRKLLEVMQNLGITTSSKKSFEVAKQTSSSEEENLRDSLIIENRNLKQENKEIEQRIKAKKVLLESLQRLAEEYENLNKENEKLRQEEQEIDQQFAEFEGKLPEGTKKFIKNKEN